MWIEFYRLNIDFLRTRKQTSVLLLNHVGTILSSHIHLISKQHIHQHFSWLATMSDCMVIFNIWTWNIVGLQVMTTLHLLWNDRPWMALPQLFYDNLLREMSSLAGATSMKRRKTMAPATGHFCNTTNHPPFYHFGLHPSAFLTRSIHYFLRNNLTTI